MLRILSVITRAINRFILVEEAFMAIDGTYEIELDSPIGEISFKLILESQGSSLKGKLESQMGTTIFDGGTVDGDKVSWDMEVSSPMGKMEITCTGTVSAAQISGEVKIGLFGAFPFQGKRI